MRPWHFDCVRDPETRRRLEGLHRWTAMLDKAPLVIAIGHPDEQKPPRTRRQVGKVSYERFGKRSR